VNSSWVPVDTCDEAVWVFSLSSEVLANTEDDSFSACVSAAKKDDDSTDLEDLS
jgi:hypothetical protein